MSRRRDKGVALVSVLWMSFLLTIIAASIARTVHVQVQTAQNAGSQADARALADSAVQLAAMDLRERLRDRNWRADGSVWTYSLFRGQVSVTVWDEGGKIDLNSAADPLLKDLFLANGVDQERADALVDAIADWRDRDDAKRLNGAEDADYRQAGLNYGAKDARFERVAELRRVLGVTSELYRKVAPALTVYSGQRGVDLSVAPPAVLRALPGLQDATYGNGGDAALTAAGQPVDRAVRLREQVEDPRLLTSSRRSAFFLRAQAETADGAVFVREAVIRLAGRGEKPFQRLFWAQGQAPALAPPNFAPR